MGDALSTVLDLPWPILAFLLLLSFGFASVALVSLFVFGVYVITRVPPFAWALRRSMWGMLEPMQSYAEDRVREIVAEELEPIHRQVFPNGGGSLSDKIDEAIRLATKANDDRARLDQAWAGTDHRLDQFDEQLRKLRTAPVTDQDRQTS